jgi:hypothetical protein
MGMGCFLSCQKQTEGNDLHWVIYIISGAWNSDLVRSKCTYTYTKYKLHLVD